MSHSDIDPNDLNGPADTADQALTIPTLPEFPGWKVEGYVLAGYEAFGCIPAREPKVVFNAHKDDDMTFSLGGDLMETMRFIARNASKQQAAEVARSVITYGLGS